LYDRQYATGEVVEDAIFDYGFRGIWDIPGGKVSVSGEAVLRYLHKQSDERWRLALMVDYHVGKSKTLSLTFGRSFEGEQSGNLLALLNLLLGFGSTRDLGTMAK
jgi:hypothetical protein